jgi:hypothetical protein
MFLLNAPPKKRTNLHFLNGLWFFGVGLVVGDAKKFEALLLALNLSAGLCVLGFEFCCVWCWFLVFMYGEMVMLTPFPNVFLLNVKQGKQALCLIVLLFKRE